MNGSPYYQLSPSQMRYRELIKQCGLDHEEAMYALGRRAGGMPEYRKMTCQQQSNKVGELIGLGLTDEEAKRVVGSWPIQGGNGLRVSQDASADQMNRIKKRHNGRKAAKRRADFKKYKKAFAHPEFRGLKWIRK